MSFIAGAGKYDTPFDSVRLAASLRDLIFLIMGTFRSARTRLRFVAHTAKSFFNTTNK